MKKNIYFLEELSKDNIAIAGGKAANLGELFNKNFNVPDCFVVSVHAYEEFIKENNLKTKTSKLLEGLNVENIDQLNVVSVEIKKLILKSRMSDKLKREIEENLGRLKTKLYAVRSSATAEDLPTASFAGQQDTFLHTKKEDVIENIKKCWASLYNTRAIYYRKKHRIKGDVGIAVVIMKMIEPEVAGVIFTVDPIEKKYLLIEAARAIGEDIVSGRITPNNYFLDKKSLRIEKEHYEHEISKHLMIDLAKIALEIENHYNSPQDIEFAVDKKGEIFILQSRPITTL